MPDAPEPLSSVRFAVRVTVFCAPLLLEDESGPCARAGPAPRVTAAIIARADAPSAAREFSFTIYSFVNNPRGGPAGRRLFVAGWPWDWSYAVSYTHLRAHETDSYLVCRLLLEKKQKYQ